MVDFVVQLLVEGEEQVVRFFRGVFPHGEFVQDFDGGDQILVGEGPALFVVGEAAAELPDGGIAGGHEAVEVVVGDLAPHDPDFGLPAQPGDSLPEPLPPGFVQPLP